MAKTKEPKTSSKKASQRSNQLSAVKNASVTKPSQTPVAKSKQIAKDTAAKVNGKKSRSQSSPSRNPRPNQTPATAPHPQMPILEAIVIASRKLPRLLPQQNGVNGRRPMASRRKRLIFL